MERVLVKFQRRACPYCAKEVLHRNLPRHVVRFHTDAIALAMRNSGIPDDEDHGEPPHEAAVCRRRDDTTLSDVSDMTTSEGVSPSTSHIVSPGHREAYSKAAVDLLDRHEEFHEEGLMKHLAEQHPLVEASHRFPLIIGATMGAQLAAKLHMFTQCAQNSPSGTRRRKVADNAACALSYWNFGMRIGTQPTVPVFRGPGSFFDEEEESVPEHTTTQRQVTSTKTRMLLPDLTVPVSFEQANRDFPEELSDDELCERPLMIDTRPNEERPITTSTSTPTTSTMMSVMSGRMNMPYVPELKKSTATTQPVAYIPTPLKKLPDNRVTTMRRTRSDDEESRQRSRSTGDRRTAKSSIHGVLSPNETTVSTAKRATVTRTTAATATVTSTQPAEKIEKGSRMCRMDQYRGGTAQRHLAHAHATRPIGPNRGDEPPWRPRSRERYMSREEQDRMHHGQYRRWN